MKVRIYALAILALLPAHTAFAAEGTLEGKPGITGHATPADYYRPQPPKSPHEMPPRATIGQQLDEKFRELLVAVLLFDCGDRHGKARAILEAYTRDVHGHFAAYARAALDGALARNLER